MACAGISGEEQPEYSWEGERELDSGPIGLKSVSRWASSKLYSLGGGSFIPSEFLIQEKGELGT